ncbi:MAG: DUF1499 domain-containing protein [Flavobacteriales bacterium]
MKLALIGCLAVYPFLIAPFNLINSAVEKLKPCPKSPNCVCTQEDNSRKKMEPIYFPGDAQEAATKLERLISNYESAVLVKQEPNYYHYEFVTRLGKFTDDIEFLIDPTAKLIHFRSASRIGYGDFGKNKRRMKKIKSDWISER